MRLKFSALLGCQLWEKGLSMTNPVYFVPVCGGENLAWHQMPLNRFFSQQKQKMAAPPLLSSYPLSFPAWQAHWIRLVFHIFVKSMVAMVSAPVWGWTCVYCMHYGMLRKEKAVWSAGALWCHIQVCETVCVFKARQLSTPQGSAESRRP